MGNEVDSRSTSNPRTAPSKVTRNTPSLTWGARNWDSRAARVISTELLDLFDSAATCWISETRAVVFSGLHQHRSKLRFAAWFQHRRPSLRVAP
jgi:hypothetical protein